MAYNIDDPPKTILEWDLDIPDTEKKKETPKPETRTDVIEWDLDVPDMASEPKQEETTLPSENNIIDWDLDIPDTPSTTTPEKLFDHEPLQKYGFGDKIDWRKQRPQNYDIPKYPTPFIEQDPVKRYFDEIESLDAEIEQCEIDLKNATEGEHVALLDPDYTLNVPPSRKNSLIVSGDYDKEKHENAIRRRERLKEVGVPKEFRERVDEFESGVEKALIVNNEYSRNLQADIQKYKASQQEYTMVGDAMIPKPKSKNDWTVSDIDAKVKEAGELAARKRDLLDTQTNIGYIKKYLDPTITQESREAALKGLFGSKTFIDLFSAGLSEMSRQKNVQKAAAKAEIIRKGLTENKPLSELPQLTDEETALLTSYGIFQMVSSAVEPSMTYTVASGVTQMIPYLLSMYLTSGIYSGVRAGVSAGLGKTMDLVAKATKFHANALGKTAAIYGAKSASYLTAQAARTVFMPMLQTEYAKEKTGIIDPVTALPKQGSIKSDWDAMRLAALRTYGEVFWEDMGGIMYNKPFSYIAKRMKGSGKLATGTYKIVEKMNEIGGGIKYSKYLKNTPAGRFADKVQFDGFIAEYLEELGTHTTTWLGEKMMGEEGQGAFWDWKQQFATFLTVTFAGGAFYGAGKLGQKYQILHPEEYYTDKEIGELDAISTLDNPLEIAARLGEFFQNRYQGEILGGKTKSEKQIKKEHLSAAYYIGNTVALRGGALEQEYQGIVSREIDKNVGRREALRDVETLVNNVTNQEDGNVHYFEDEDGKVWYVLNMTPQGIEQNKNLDPVERKVVIAVDANGVERKAMSGRELPEITGVESVSKDQFREERLSEAEQSLQEFYQQEDEMLKTEAAPEGEMYNDRIIDEESLLRVRAKREKQRVAKIKADRLANLYNTLDVAAKEVIENMRSEAKTMQENNEDADKIQKQLQKIEEKIYQKAAGTDQGKALLEEYKKADSIETPVQTTTTTQTEGVRRQVKLETDEMLDLVQQEDGSWMVEYETNKKKEAETKLREIEDSFGDDIEGEIIKEKKDPNDKFSEKIYRIRLKDRVEEEVETKEEVKKETEQPKAKEETQDAEKVGKETTKTSEQEKPKRGKQGQVRVRDNEKGGVEAETGEKQKAEVKEKPVKNTAREIIGENSEIQEKETKKGYIARILNQINKKAKSAGKLVIVENSNDKGLSKPVKDKLAKSVAVYNPKTKTVFVNTEKIQDKELTPEFLFDLWLHEMGVHHGIENIYEFKDKKAISEKITSDIGRDVIIERINELRKEKGFAALKDTDKIDDFVLGEEYMAYLSAKVISGQDLTPAERGVWQKIVDEVIKQINKILGTDIKFTDADIARIIRASVQSNFIEPVATPEVKQGELFAGEQVKEKEVAKKVTKEAEKVTEITERLNTKDFKGLDNKVLNGLDVDNRDAIAYLNEYPDRFLGVNDTFTGAEKITGITNKGDARIEKVSSYAIELNFGNTKKVMHFLTEESKNKAVDKIYDFTREKIKKTKQPKPTPKKSGVQKDVERIVRKATKPKPKEDKPDVNNPETTYVPKEKLTKAEAKKRAENEKKLGKQNERIQKGVDKMMIEHERINLGLIERYCNCSRKDAEIVLKELELNGLVSPSSWDTELFLRTGKGTDMLYQLDAEREYEEMLTEEQEGEEMLVGIDLSKELAKVISQKDAYKQHRRFWDSLRHHWIGRRDLNVFNAAVKAKMLQQEIKNSFNKMKEQYDKEGKQMPFKDWKELNYVMMLRADLGDEAKAEAEILKFVDESFESFMDKFSYKQLLLDKQGVNKQAEIYEKWQERIRIVQLAKELNDEQKDIIKKAREQFDKLGAIAQAADVIMNVRENYVARAWIFPKRSKGDTPYSTFQLSTIHSRNRVYPSIIDAWLDPQMAMAELRYKGLEDALFNAEKSVYDVIENRRLIDQALKVKNLKGQALFVTEQTPGYKRIEDPNFVNWEYSFRMTMGQYWQSQKKTKSHYGDNVRYIVKEIEDENGKKKKVVDVQVKKYLYAPVEKNFFDSSSDVSPYENIEKRWTKFKEHMAMTFAVKKVGIAESVDWALGIERPIDTPIIREIAYVNAFWKRILLSFSFFHHQAFLRSFYLGGAVTLKNWNFVKAYKQGLKAAYDINDPDHPYAKLLIYNGLTLGRIQEWNREQAARKTAIGEILDDIPVAGYMKDKVIQASDWWTRGLFETFGAGLKMKAAILELQREMVENPFIDENVLAQRVAGLINSDFGGLHLQRMGRNPTWQRILRFVLLAPDWCLDSETQAFTKTGWKYYHELTVGKDEILAFNPDTKKYQWSLLNDMYVNEKYHGKMLSVNNHNRAIKMTPSHKCYVWNISKKKHEIIEAYEINTAHRIPRSANFDTPNESPFNDEFIKLVGWVVTDGYFKKSKFKLASGQEKICLHAKITQSKPDMVDYLKTFDMKFHIDKLGKEHDGIVCNYRKYVFTVKKEYNNLMLNEGINNGLSWEFLSKLTKSQLKILYDVMMMGDGTGQNRFCGKEKEVFYMTMVQTMLGKASTFYQQEKNCWRTRVLSESKKHISCHKKTTSEIYKGTIWCPSVDTGFWLANRGGLTFITGNTESNYRTVYQALKSGESHETIMYRTFWKRIMTRGIMTVAILNLLTAAVDDGWGDDPEKSWWQNYWIRVIKRLKYAWDAGYLKWLMWDITPLYRYFKGIDKQGKTKEGEEDLSRHYFSIFGHFLDTGKLVSDPMRTLKGKGSIMGRGAFDAFTGQNWKNQPFTPVYAMLGLKDMGTTKEGMPMVWDYMWTLTMKNMYNAPQKPITWAQIPAWAINTLIGVAPIGAGAAMSFAVGEIDGWELAGKGVGAHLARASMRTKSEVEEEFNERMDYYKSFKDYAESAEKEENIDVSYRKYQKDYPKGKLTKQEYEDVIKQISDYIADSRTYNIAMNYNEAKKELSKLNSEYKKQEDVGDTTNMRLIKEQKFAVMEDALNKEEEIIKDINEYTDVDLEKDRQGKVMIKDKVTGKEMYKRKRRGSEKYEVESPQYVKDYEALMKTLKPVKTSNFAGDIIGGKKEVIGIKQYYVGNKLRGHQLQIENLNKELLAAMGKEDTKEIDRITKERKDLMEDALKISKEYDKMEIEWDKVDIVYDDTGEAYLVDKKTGKKYSFITNKTNNE